MPQGMGEREKRIYLKENERKKRQDLEFSTPKCPRNFSAGRAEIIQPNEFGRDPHVVTCEEKLSDKIKQEN